MNQNDLIEKISSIIACYETGVETYAFDDHAKLAMAVEALDSIKAILPEKVTSPTQVQANKHFVAESDEFPPIREESPFQDKKYVRSIIVDTNLGVGCLMYNVVDKKLFWFCEGGVGDIEYWSYLPIFEVPYVKKADFIRRSEELYNQISGK